MSHTVRERRVIGNKFRKLRVRLHLSQAEFAQLLGRDRLTIHHIEKGNKYPQYETLRRFDVLEAQHAKKKQVTVES